MSNFIWCEDTGSGYQFWDTLFKTVYPQMSVVSQKGNSRLSKAVEQINEDGNIYYIMIDEAIDNPDVLREMTRLKKSISGKNNIRLIKIPSFEFALLSFEYLEQWVFAEKDDLRDKRQNLLDARKKFIKLIVNGGTSEELNEFKSVYQFQDKANTEKISAKLLFGITKNTGFETDKSRVGSCFILDCCDWSKRQEDDICGLENHKLTVHDKMEQIIKHSVLDKSFKEAGL